MTTPNPLTQQRQFVRDFVAASKQRSERERTAQQQYATGEKAAQEQYAGSERAAQQSYAAAITNDDLSPQKSQLSQTVGLIANAQREAVGLLRLLGVPASEFPPTLDQVNLRSTEDETNRNAIAEFLRVSSHFDKLIDELKESASQLAHAKRRRQTLLMVTGLIVAVGVVVVLFQFNTILGFLAILVVSLSGLAFWDGWRLNKTAHRELMASTHQSLLTSELLAAQKQGLERVQNPVDGAVYVFVPAGEFTMGSPDSTVRADEYPQHTIHLDAFWVMQTEVTNAQYAKCVAAGACSAPHNRRWQNAAYADHPVTDINWNQAKAYAQWAGGRLPTEAEWEKAARGTDGRTYPWGNEQPNQSLVNCCNFISDTTPVGSYPAGASPYGALDMAGNVWEWTADWYNGGYYNQSPVQNPTGPASGNARVSRGGSAWNDASVVRVAFRGWNFPNLRDRYNGFRVASSSPGF
jgi:formylglycine-generating enzyme required for sulfatase activity